MNESQSAIYKAPRGRDDLNGEYRFAFTLFGLPRNGGNGKVGKNGPDLKIYVSPEKKYGLPLFRFCIINVSKKHTTTDTFYLNPLKGQLFISTEGGDGGNGGFGEQKNGYTGFRGNGGNGGNGGAIEIYTDSITQHFIQRSMNSTYFSNILLSNPGGIGGDGGVDGDGNGLHGINGPEIFYRVE